MVSKGFQFCKILDDKNILLNIKNYGNGDLNFFNTNKDVIINTIDTCNGVIQNSLWK